MPVTRPCEVRGCPGQLVRYETRVQVLTGDVMERFECDTDHHHRAWIILSLGVLHRERAGRWDKLRGGSS